MTSLSLLLHYSIFRPKNRTIEKRFWRPSISHFFIVLRLNLNDGKNDLDFLSSQYARQKYFRGTTFPSRAETRRKSWMFICTGPQILKSFF